MIEDQIFHPIVIFVFHHQGDKTRLLRFEMNGHSGLLAGAIIIWSKGAPLHAQEADAIYQKTKRGEEGLSVHGFDQYNDYPNYTELAEPRHLQRRRWRITTYRESQLTDAAFNNG
jgi:hypothetical protein